MRGVSPAMMALVFVVAAAGVTCKSKKEETTPKPGRYMAKRSSDPFSALGVMEERPEDRRFKLSPGPKPPHRVSRKVSHAFPPPEREKGAAARKNYGPLKVVRTQPTGKVGKIAAIAVSFNHPMVPLASLEEQRKIEPPIEMEPKLEGKFRWLGTKVLAFETKSRFPFSTKFEVKIPAGAESAVGGKLEKERSFTFHTPRTRLEWMRPSRSNTHAVPNNPILLSFNQKVIPEDVLEHAKLVAATGKGAGHEVPLELVPRKRWDKVSKYRGYFGSRDKEKMVVLRPAKPMALNTTHTLVLKPGLGSAEGPLKTTKTQKSSFRTYGPLLVKHAGCWRGKPCRPGASPYIAFTNSVKTGEYELEKEIRIRPKPEGLEVRGGGSRLYLRGKFEPGKTYRVSVSRKVRDIYGQRLKRRFRGKIVMLDAAPLLHIAKGKRGVLESREQRALPVRSVNVPRGRVTLVEVTPDEVAEARNLVYRSNWRYRKTGKAVKLAGRRKKFTKRFNSRNNGVEKSFIKLDRILGKRGGTVFVEVFSQKLKSRRYDDGYRYYLVTVTDIGVTARYDLDRVAGLVTGLTSGKPLEGAKVSIFDGSHKEVWSGTTSKDGMFTAPGARKLGGKRPYLLVARARRGKDWSFVRLTGSGVDGYVSGYSHASLPPKRRLVSHLYTDRDPYRPGDEVEIVGVLRTEPTGTKGGIEWVDRKGVEIRYSIRDPRGRTVKKGKLDVDRQGTFHLTFPTKPECALGAYYFKGKVHGVSGLSSTPWVSHAFKVLEFRAPEHETKVELEAGPHFYGEEIEGEIVGKYHFGAPMSGAKASWTLRRRRGTYRPPHHTGYHFGIGSRRRGWHWRHRHGYRGNRVGSYWVSRGSGGARVGSGEGKLDDKGRLEVSHPLVDPAGKKGAPYPGVFTLEAQVFDVNRQSVAGRQVFLAHPASVYVGLRTSESIIKAGQPVEIDTVVADLDGQRVSGRPVSVKATRQKRIRKKVKKKKSFAYEYEYKTVVGGQCKTRSSAKAQKCTFVLKEPGYYTLTAESTDPKGRRTVTQRGIYVFGKGHVRWRQSNMRKVDLIPDKGTYRPGDKAKVLIKSPYRKAVGILAVERQGIITHRKLDISSSTHVEEVDISADHIPNVHVSVVLVRGRVKQPEPSSEQDLGRPMFATGRIPLRISKRSKRVVVGVEPGRKTIKPGEKLRVKLETRDHRGKPVRARLSLMVVDEGVLSLLGFKTPNPMDVFYHEWRPRSGANELRRWLLKKVLPKLRLKAGYRRRNGGRRYMQKARIYANGGARRRPPPPEASASRAPAKRAEKGGGSGGETKKFKVRRSFATTAFFSHDVRTDRSGNAELTIQMPENLTAFRLMAVAQDVARADRFGSGEARVRIRKELLLRPALPRFANFGDIFEAGVVVNNETGGGGEVTVKIQGVGFRVLEGSTKKVKVEDGKAEEVRFKVAVTRPGLARFRFSAFKGKKTDSVEPPPIPILLPATAEATAVYGVTTKSVAHPIRPPEEALAQFGGMEVSMSSTALTGLQDAVEYLVSYPYGCAEQVASRLVPIFALSDILPAFGVESLADKAKQRRYAEKGIRRLISLQKHDGGFKFWSSSWRSYPYPSVYATWALLRGKQAGFDVPEDVLRKASRYLSRVLYGRYDRTWPGYYSRTVKVMAGWLLTELRDADFISKYQKRRWNLKRHLGDIYKARAKLGVFAKAWLMTALFRLEKRSQRVEELLREIENSAVQSPYGIHFTEGTTESLRLLMHTNTRTDAIVLSSYMEVDPKNVIVPKIVRALMAARVKGRWETTQANAFVMESLAGYFRKYEKVEPEFKAHIWYGTGYGGSAEFTGRSMEIVDRELPMSFLLAQGDKDLVLAKKGAGKLYYRLGLDYAPKSLRLPPEEQGFMVRRVYEPVEGADTVVKGKDGIWRIKAGSYVRVRLTVVVSDRRYFVAVNDPLPAGLEGVDLQLRTSASSRLSGHRRNKIYDFRSYYAFRGPSHKEMRDERYVLFWDRLPAGVYEYTYLARATTIGRFVVPPLKAMEMYHPEVFGRNGTQIVEVVE